MVEQIKGDFGKVFGKISPLICNNVSNPGKAV